VLIELELMGRFKGKKEEEEEEEEEERLKGRDRFRPGVRAAEPPNPRAAEPRAPSPRRVEPISLHVAPSVSEGYGETYA
jgi:hypothetical protein